LIEMAGLEAGAWRGRIEDGEVVEEHDPGYDEPYVRRRRSLRGCLR
jgi:hypothetical protein